MSINIVETVFISSIIAIVVTFAYVITVDLLTPEKKQSVNKKKKSVKGRL